MEALNQLGYSIYRLKEAKESDEFLLYVHKTQIYYCYSKKRIFDIFKKLLDESNFDYNKFGDLIGVTKISKDKVINFLIEENYKLIDNFGYIPLEKKIFEENNKILFNTYKKSKFLKEFRPNKDLDFPNIRELILNLVGNNEEEYNYFCKWLAFILKNPLQRLSTSIILQGEQGTGKTQFCNLVLKTIFDSNFCEIGQSQVESEFNDFIMGRQLVVANEVMHNENKFQMSDRLKSWVCDSPIPIRRMYKGVIDVNNYSQFIFTSNQLTVIKIEKGDRRYSVFRSKKLKDGWRLIGDLKNNLQEELTGFVTYLFNLEVDYQEVDKPIHNEYKQEIINTCQSNVEEFIQELQELGGMEELALNLKVKVDLKPKFAGTNQVIEFSEIYKLYCFYCDFSNVKRYSKNNFSRHLRNNGFITKTVRIEERITKALIVGELKDDC